MIKWKVVHEEVENILVEGQSDPTNMKVTTYVRLLTKLRLAAIKIDKDGDIKPHFCPVSIALTLIFLALSVYYSYLRISDIGSVNFNLLSFEFLMFQMIVLIAFAKGMEYIILTIQVRTLSPIRPELSD